MKIKANTTQGIHIPKMLRISSWKVGSLDINATGNLSWIQECI